MPSLRSGITSGLGLCIRPYRYASQLVRRYDVLRTVKWQNLGYIYKRRLASEMFKIVEDPGNHRLSSHFTIRETEREGKQLVVKRMNTERGRNSVTYRGPIVWNALSNSLREEDKLVSFEKKLKTSLKTLEQISFRKGTVFSNNKNLENFVYY